MTELLQVRVCYNIPPRHFVISTIRQKKSCYYHELSRIRFNTILLFLHLLFVGSRVLVTRATLLAMAPETNL